MLGGSWHMRYYDEDGVLYREEDRGDNGFYLFGNIAATRRVKSLPTVFHAQVRYTYEYNEFQRKHASGLALLDSLGVKLDATIIWNAIPWSFVVDWFIGVGRWLSDNASLGGMDPSVRILRYCYSVNRVREIHAGVNLWESRGGYNNRSSVAFPVITESAYTRQVVKPSKVWLTTSGLSPTEFSLGVALLLTRKRKPKRRKSAAWQILHNRKGREAEKKILQRLGGPSNLDLLIELNRMTRKLASSKLTFKP